MRNGIIVSDSVVRAWHDKRRSYTPVQEVVHELESGEIETRPTVTPGDLRQHSLRIRRWYHRDGMSVEQVTQNLRKVFAAGLQIDPLCDPLDLDPEYKQLYHECGEKDVSHKVVYEFLRSNPMYEITHW